MLLHNFEFQLPFAEGKITFFSLLENESKLKHIKNSSPFSSAAHIPTLYPSSELGNLRSGKLKSFPGTLSSLVKAFFYFYSWSL